MCSVHVHVCCSSCRIITISTFVYTFILVLADSIVVCIRYCIMFYIDHREPGFSSIVEWAGPDEAGYVRFYVCFTKMFWEG